MVIKHVETKITGDAMSSVIWMRFADDPTAEDAKRRSNLRCRLRPCHLRIRATIFSRERILTQDFR